MTWQFDGMYRLTNEISVSTSLSPTYAYTNSYQYDLAGNRLHKVRTGGGAETINYDYDANDELLYETNGATTTAYLYDANGSLTNQATGSTNYSYAYNLMNKLSSVTSSSGTTSFQYNDQGIRVRMMGASTKYYLVDANNHTGYQQVLEEFATLGSTPTRSYVIGDDVLAQADSGSASYLLYDGHGSTRQIDDSSGNVTSRYNYDAYGITQATTSTSSAETSFLYCGEQFDSTLQMYNLRARFYNPSNGRFNQRDSSIGNGEDPQSLHKYLYTYCDPVNSSDPSGNDVLQLIVVGAIIGAIMGGVIGGILNGWRGAVKGIITGALVGPLFALGIAGAGAALAGILWAVFGSAVISSQLATFIVAALVTAKGISDVSNELDKIDLSKPTADREILACQVELVSMFLLQALSAIPLGKSGKMSLSEGREVRANYDAGAEEIADTADSMQRQGKPLKEIAKTLSDMRRANRIAARQKMSSWLDVQMLEARDFAKYGDPDGPSFEWKISQAQSKGLTGDDVWKYIISSASRTDQATSERFK
jgi:RHS repeat-associated protein